MCEDGTSHILKVQAGEKIYVAGRFEKKKMDVLETMKKGGDVKQTVVIFPGITQGYTSKSSALAYMNPYASGVTKVIFEIEPHVSGNSRPLDAKKLIGDDSA